MFLYIYLSIKHTNIWSHSNCQKDKTEHSCTVCSDVSNQSNLTYLYLVQSDLISMDLLNGMYLYGKYTFQQVCMAFAINKWPKQ